MDMGGKKVAQKKMAMEFAEALDKVTDVDTFPDVSAHTITDALGLPRGLTATQTFMSVAQIKEVMKNGLEADIQPMQQLFLLGLKLGVAYGIKVAKCDKLHAGEF